MTKPNTEQSKERASNAAQPPGKHDGLRSDHEIDRAGKQSRRAAGPDGPAAREIGDTFKK